MRRDWNLIGDIFKAIEEERLESMLDTATPDDKEKTLWHLELLLDAGYIKGVFFRVSVDGMISYGCNRPRITLQGYDFAEVVMDQKLLNKTINIIKKAGLMVGFETLKSYAPIALKSIVALTN